ncbi:hypothetical protein JSQ81_03600 [Sporosarcina sp. Marseille-Q4063]|uniref:hypothetical protein n=1 Tax=Sporosarcina sp. Marseille-Q4063 TaxID=2810514 RepID=UPI001BB07F71|nr:hypothetical protein [Sporosarcina sp. Marseille-Q4063]QUW22679.1 hypothetical protein JSQ81_03600 [Sporosarcina sp. Marseille-Q4063]
MAVLYAVLFWISAIISPIIFLYGIFKRSWVAMVLCFFTVLPFSLYALSGEPFVSYIGYMPLILLLLAVLFYKKSRNPVKKGT